MGGLPNPWGHYNSLPTRVRGAVHMLSWFVYARLPANSPVVVCVCVCVCVEFS